jgi:hypothetical protein
MPPKKKKARSEKPEPQQVEVIIKVVHEYKPVEHDNQYKQSHPDEYEWSNFWNDWVPKSYFSGR